MVILTSPCKYADLFLQKLNCVKIHGTIGNYVSSCSRSSKRFQVFIIDIMLENNKNCMKCK